MIILKYKYKLLLSKEKIDYWLGGKLKERTSIFKFRKYKVRITEKGFRIRKLRFYKHEPFYPQMIAKYGFDNKSIEIKIRPSLIAIIFFSFFWLIALIIIYILKKSMISGFFTSFEISDNLISLGIAILMLTSVILFFLVWPNFKARKWIENELELTNRQK